MTAVLRMGKSGTETDLPVHASQNPCFRPGTHEDQAIKALKESCYGAGHTSEEIGKALVDAGLYRSRRGSGGAHVRACLNPGKSEFFSPSEILFIQSLTGVYAWFEFEARMLGFRAERADLCAEMAEAINRAMRFEAQAQEERERAASLQLRAREGRRQGPRWNPTQGAKFSRQSLGGEEVSRQAHTLENAGSSPAPATNTAPPSPGRRTPERHLRSVRPV